MQYYNARIRLAGSMLNEVRRKDISAPEIMLLKKIHGDESVLDVELAKNDPVDHSEERQRLFTTYSTAVNVEAKRHYIEELFGPAHQDLPLEDPAYRNLVRAALADKVSRKNAGKADPNEIVT